MFGDRKDMGEQGRRRKVGGNGDSGSVSLRHGEKGLNDRPTGTKQEAGNKSIQ